MKIMMHFGYVFVLCVACANASPWPGLSKNSSNSQSEELTDIQYIVRNPEIQKLRTLVKLSSDLKSDKTGCSCVKYNCGCCAHIDIKEIHLNTEVCVNLTYLPAPEYGISVSLIIGGKTIIKEKVSARNPPPICVDVPHLKKYASICLEFNDMNISKSSIAGCLKLEARLFKIRVTDVKIGCFTIPLKSQEQGRQLWNSHFDHQGRESNDIWLEDKHPHDNVSKRRAANKSD